MTLASFFRLLILAAIWGGSFLFMRIAANPLGPAVLIESRVGLAALTLLILSFYLKRRLRFSEHARHFFILGLFNSALPFLLFAYAAQSISASTLAILNSTAPIWGAVIGAVWSRTRLTAKVSLGLSMGIAGVVVLVGWNGEHLSSESMWPIIAAIMAAFCYGIATNYTKRATQVPAFDNAHGSMWASAMLGLPLMFIMPIREMPTFDVSLSVILLGVVCTGLAYLIFFRLVADVGPSSTLSVTFLIPIFGILWGHLILDETIGVNTFFGSLLVVSGTMLVTGFSPVLLFKKSRLTLKNRIANK
jgi:drug/metabolite transporter (DMT)-like permease